MDVFFLVMEYVGIIAFSVSGAMVAIDKEADIVGVVIMAIVTSFGGGIIRDIFLGQLPPRFFTEYHIELLVCVLSALTVFFFAFLSKKEYVRREEKINSIINIFDAAGIGAFSVYGVNVAIEMGFTAPLVAISMGIIGSVCGGLVRDLMLKNIPFILMKKIYVLACLAGSAAFYVSFVVLNINAAVCSTIGFAVTFVLRMLATYFKWNLPRAINFSSLDEKSEDEENQSNVGV